MPKLKRIKPVRSKAEKRLPARLAIKSEIMAVSRGNRPFAGDEAVGQDGDEPLSGRVDDPAAGDPGGVAAQPHGHGQALLAAGAALFKGAVHIEGDSGKIAGILQKSKKRKEDRHRRQHHGDDPGRYPVNAVDQDAGQPPGGHGEFRRFLRGFPRRKKASHIKGRDGNWLPSS